MPTGVVDSPRDEEKWQKAKRLAEKAGRKEDYAYIMGIYKKTKPSHDFKKTALFKVAQEGGGGDYGPAAETPDDQKGAARPQHRSGPGFSYGKVLSKRRIRKPWGPPEKQTRGA